MQINKIKIIIYRSQSINSKGKLEQSNKVTAWLDSSQIYGSFLCQSKHLSSRSGDGKLKTLPHPLSSNFKPLPPRVATNHECLSDTGLCFRFLISYLFTLKGT